VESIVGSGFGFEPEVSVGFAGLVAHFSHVVNKVIPEGCACTLQPVQSSHDYSFLSTVGPKLFPESGPKFFRDWCCEGDILNVSCLDLQVVSVM
jgi:hypothetical protein